MLEQFKYTLFYNWNVVRIIRIGIGLIALYRAVEANDWLIGILAVLLLSQGLFNWGCCGVSSCAPKRNNQQQADTVKDVEYEEVK